MSRPLKKRSKKAGLSPGTLIHIGEKKTEKPRITIIDYDEEQFQEKEIETIEECFPFKEKPTMTWINIDGIHQVELIEKIGKHFDIHPLVLEDILNTTQRPKIEDFEDYIFAVLRMVYNKEKNEEEQISIILGLNFVISFQEREGDIFESVRERIRNGKGRIRKMGSDYLAYALIDAVIDNYFVILEHFGEKIESLEEELMTNPHQETSREIHRLKKEMVFLHKSIWPLREVVNNLERDESPLIQATTGIYLKDVHDHIIQIIDIIELYRDMLSGIFDNYLSNISTRMNEIMKVLTIISTIFMPLTFIVGIYGMNFEYMPELKCQWGYPGVLLVIMMIGVFMLLYFRRKKWL